MAGVVDADTHIAESEAMWNYIDRKCIRADRIFCPQWWRRFFATMREPYTGFLSRKLSQNRRHRRRK